jgi:hypothetical protein
MVVELRFRIILESPPIGVDFGLQQGKGNDYRTVQKQRSKGEDLAFEGTVTVKNDQSEGPPNFLGPLSQGPKGGRFLFIGVGKLAGQEDSEWVRRIKVPLTGISWDLIERTVADPALVLEARVPGTGRDGGPSCATLKCLNRDQSQKGGRMRRSSALPVKVLRGNLLPLQGLKRRAFLRTTGGLLVVGLRGYPVLGDEPDHTTPALAAERARRFLASLFDPALGLLPEFQGSKVYWLYHDNYLAAKVLEKTEPDLARKIRDAINGFGVTGSGKIEILFSEAKEPLPFRHYKLEDVKRVGDKVIRTEVVGKEVHEDWERYSDLLFMATIAEAGREKSKAVGHFEAGMKTWDGKGIRDRASEKGGLYATYKLALALIAGARLDRKVGERAKILERLLAMQRQDGGFVTDYDPQGKPVGQANVETTSLAILALDGLVER